MPGSTPPQATATTWWPSPRASSTSCCAAIAPPRATRTRATSAPTTRSSCGWATARASRWPTAASGARSSCRRSRPKRKRGEALAPQERLAAILGGRDTLLVGEELLLRAQLDLDAGRTREAALQARVALESLLGELDEKFSAPLRPLRDPVARAANAALDGELSAEDATALAEAVEQMAAAARRSGTAAGTA